MLRDACGLIATPLPGWPAATPPSRAIAASIQRRPELPARALRRARAERERERAARLDRRARKDEAVRRVELAEALPAHAADGAALLAFAQSVATQIGALPKGRALVVPVGWSTGAASHVLLLAVGHTADGSYEAWVCNAGAGVEYLKWGMSTITNATFLISPLIGHLIDRLGFRPVGLLLVLCIASEKP